MNATTMAFTPEPAVASKMYSLPKESFYPGNRGRFDTANAAFIFVGIFLGRLEPAVSATLRTAQPQTSVPAPLLSADEAR